jgi:hypothetical protein
MRDGTNARESAPRGRGADAIQDALDNDPSGLKSGAKRHRHAIAPCGSGFIRVPADDWLRLVERVRKAALKAKPEVGMTIAWPKKRLDDSPSAQLGIRNPERRRR